MTLDYRSNDVGLGITRTAARFDTLASTENESGGSRGGNAQRDGAGHGNGEAQRGCPAEALSALQDDEGKAQAVTEEAGIVTGHPVYESFLGFTSARELQQATRQPSGQVHADMASAQINESRYPRDAATERLRQAEGRRIASDIKADDNGAWAKLLGTGGMLPATIMPPVTKRPPTACCWAWMASCLTTPAGLG